MVFILANVGVFISRAMITVYFLFNLTGHYSHGVQSNRVILFI